MHKASSSCPGSTDLRFLLPPPSSGKVLHMYGAALRQQAYHVASLPPAAEVEGLSPHAEAAAFLRRSAGIYTFLSDWSVPNCVY